MTLHWWMHWFWITLHLVLCHSTLAQPNGIDDLKAVTGTTYIPPNIYNNTVQNITINPSVPPVTSSSNIMNKTSINKISTSNITIEVNPLESISDYNNQTTELPGSTHINSMNATVSLIDCENCLNASILNVEERIDVANEDLEGHHNLSAASITGISLGIVAFFGLVVTVSVVIYRNRSLNRPQVLNDRCSNPDSSGYIDDSTIRENSEEMYSLDNDSFLNSLEAMTIQNYWTDTVKHTKL